MIEVSTLRASFFRGSLSARIFILLAATLLAPPAFGQLETADDIFAVSFGGTTTILAPGVRANDSGGGSGDSDAASANAVLVAAPASHTGTFTLNADGSFAYAHNGGPNILGQDSFTYQLVDTFGSSNVSTVTLDIRQGSLLLARDDRWPVEFQLPFEMWPPGVLANDGNNGATGMTATLISGPSHGLFNLNADGSFTYIHDGTDVPTDSFTYQTTDGVDTSNVATVTFDIVAASPPPGGDGSNSSPGQLTLRFTNVVAARAVSTIGASAFEQLEIRAPTTEAAQVVNWVDFTTFTNPQSTIVFTVETTDATYLEAAREIYGECRRAALIAEARPGHYALEVRLDLPLAGALLGATSQAIGALLPEGTLECALERIGG